MRGDLIRIPENIEQDGYDFIDLLEVAEEDFPLYGIARTEGFDYGVILVYSRGSFHPWELPSNGSEYVEIIERFQ